MQRHGSACDLGMASECFEGLAEGLRTTLKLFEASICGVRVKAFSRAPPGPTREPDQGSLFSGKEGGRTNFVTFLRLILERVRTTDMAWEWLRDSDLHLAMQWLGTRSMPIKADLDFSDILAMNAGDRDTCSRHVNVFLLIQAYSGAFVVHEQYLAAGFECRNTPRGLHEFISTPS
ncbi:hypothetical protein C8R43DRAFT_956237 [Mycena crocata]|nr:hypothetical protein C8R43DRAFT_956237 [Mycena crocata]